MYVLSQAQLDVVVDDFCADYRAECRDAWRMFEAAKAHVGELVAEVERLRAGIEWLDLDFLEDVASDLGHTIYEATESEPAECTDECSACCIEELAARLRALVAPKGGDR